MKTQAEHLERLALIRDTQEPWQFTHQREYEVTEPVLDADLKPVLDAKKRPKMQTVTVRTKPLLSTWPTRELAERAQEQIAAHGDRIIGELVNAMELRAAAKAREEEEKD